MLCLLLNIRSPTTYNFLRTNDLLPLPAVSTIRNYLSRVKVQCVLDDQFFEAFKQKLKSQTDIEKQEILAFDEMAVRKSIALNVRNLKLVGIQDFGKENRYTAKCTDKQADHALVFMWLSLGGGFSQPVAVIAAQGATAGTCLAK